METDVGRYILHTYRYVPDFIYESPKKSILILCHLIIMKKVSSSEAIRRGFSILSIVSRAPKSSRDIYYRLFEDYILTYISATTLADVSQHIGSFSV